MNTNSAETPQLYGVPLTHRACLMQPANRTVWLQVQRYDRRRPFTLCGRLIGLTAADDGAELFKVLTDIGQYTVAPRNARLCSGDGRCGCEAVASE